MKVSLNSAFYSALPNAIADHVRTWARARRRRHASVEITTRFFVAEDATYTAFAADALTHKTADAGGEWRGPTGLRPGAECPLPAGCTVVETGWFLGKAFLTIYHNGNPAWTGVAGSAVPALSAA